MERHNGVEPDPEGVFVYYETAQSTIDAIKADALDVVRKQRKELADHQQTVERLERERDKWEREARLQKEGGLRERKVADSYYQSLVKARQQVADLQAQLAAAEEERRKVSATCDMLGRERNAADEKVYSLKQQVAQLRTWQDGVVKAFVEAPLEWSPDLGVQHIPSSLPQIFKNMKDYADRLIAIQTAHTTLRNFIGVTFDAETQTWVSGKAPYFSAGTTETEACIAAVDALRLATSTLEEKYAELSMNHTTLRGLVEELKGDFHLDETYKAREQANKFEAEGDMYGWNFHQGRASGLIESQFVVRNLMRKHGIDPNYRDTLPREGGAQEVGGA